MTRTIARARIIDTPDSQGWTRAAGDPQVGDVLGRLRITDIGTHWSSGGMSGWWVQVEPA